MTEEIYYKNFKEEVDRYIDAIIKSDHSKKLILAGPGTGKSTLFKRICENNIKNKKTKNIALSFINELVNDLKKDLHNLAEVSTLHSFALKELQNTPAKGQGYFMKITEVINKDYEILKKSEIDFAEILCNLVSDSDKLEFYESRRQYYNHFGPNCSVYTLLKYYEENDKNIPQYDQCLIDEFQDFNKMEIAFINLLSSKNNILIAGDDDQSLYSFRFANPNEIRSRHQSDDHEKFKLPFCFRCTKVIVDAFNNVVEKAKSEGFLKQRINDKEYKYFPTKEKDEISKKNNQIIVKEKIFDNAVAFHIDKKIKDIFDSGEVNFSVLVITMLPIQAIRIKNDLIKKKFNNVQTSYRDKDDINKSLLDGLRLLLENCDCNLGWRIVAEQILKEKEEDFSKIIEKSHTDKGNFKSLLDKDVIESVESLLTTINKIKKNLIVTEEEYTELFKATGYDPNKITSEKLLDELEAYSTRGVSYKNIPIKITNILGSKGLTKDYVFLVNFDDKYLIGKEITDEKICNFLVALTRAKKKVYIFSQKIPSFVKWIDTTFVKKE